MKRAISLSLTLASLTGLAGGFAQPAALAQTEATPVAAATAADQYTPVVASVFSTPRWFTGSDGQAHLVYELSLLNAFPIDVTITAVDVLDGGSGETLATLSGDTLTAAMTLASVPATPSTTLPASSAGMVWLDLPFANAGDLPATIAHRVTVHVPPGLPVPTSITSDTAPATVDLRPPIVLGAPLAGAQWAAVGSCCDGPHRRSVQPVNGGLYLAQRFAIDFNQLDAENRFSTGDPARNESYPTYGQPVLAVANATVVAAVDQYEDQIPGQTVGITLENADGNYVVLDLGDGHYAFYAHLKPGSVTVRAGDTVQRGEQIGEAGNTGSSDGPHLHFHVMDSPSVLASDGLPYVFADFTVTGSMPPLSEVLPYYEAQEPVPVDLATAGPRQDELPLGGDIVAFP
ncbi:MAG: M23 family metallopeptidase [Thermomicrobiales bacterium]